MLGDQNCYFHRETEIVRTVAVFFFVTEGEAVIVGRMLRFVGRLIHALD